MLTISTLTEFLGWCTLLNFGLLALTAILLTSMRETMVRVHSRMFGVNEADLPRIYFQYLAHYQALIWVLNLVPYVALKLMA